MTEHTGQVSGAWAPLIDSYLGALAANGYTATTIMQRRGQLVRAACGLAVAPDQLDGKAVAYWIEAQPNWTAHYRVNVRTALRGFFTWAYRSGAMDRCVQIPSPGVRRERAEIPDVWAPMIRDYLTSLTAAGRPETTIKLRREHLSLMSREIVCKPAELDGERIVAWFATHSEWKTETRRSYRCTLRSFLQWAFKTNRLPIDLSDDVPTVRLPNAAPRPTPDRVWKSAVLAADQRMTLMLRLAAEAGLRRAEVAKVHTSDLMEGVHGPQLLVHGKGNKPRVVPISDDLAALIRAGAAGHTPGMPDEGWLFPGETDGHLNPRRVGALVSEALPEGWTMHTLRHRFASRAYRGTRNLRAVQVLLGHASIATTERYTAVDDGEIRAAMEAARLEPV